MPADRANDVEVFLTLEEVMKEKCLDHVTTLLGLDETTIEENFKAVDTNADGKATLKEGMKVYEYAREAFGSYGFCVYECCAFPYTQNNKFCREVKRGPEALCGGCETKFLTHPYYWHFNKLCTLKATTVCKDDDDCVTNPYAVEIGEEIPFAEGLCKNEEVTFVEAFALASQ